MSNTEITKGPAKTAGERQANRRARMAAEIEQGRVARYQVTSFNQLFTECMAEQLQFTLHPGDLDLTDPLEALNQLLKSWLLKSRELRQKHPEKHLTKKSRLVIGGAQEENQVLATVKPRAKAVRSVTDATTKGSALSRRQRERVAK